MSNQTTLAQANKPAQHSEYATSQFMGKIVGVLIIVIVVIWVVQKVRGKK
jgi:flagellar biogenesis protein FliO